MLYVGDSKSNRGVNITRGFRRSFNTDYSARRRKCEPHRRTEPAGRFLARQERFHFPEGVTGLWNQKKISTLTTS